MTRSRLVRPLIVLGLGSLFILGPVGSAIACGGLIAPNGTISLLRTTTLAGGAEDPLRAQTNRHRIPNESACSARR